MSTFTVKDLDEVINIINDHVKAEDKVWSNLFKKFGADFDRDKMIVPLKFKFELNVPTRLVGKKIFFSDYVDQCYFFNPEWKPLTKIAWRTDILTRNPFIIDVSVSIV